MNIIGVSGKIFSGKDEIGKIIQYLTSEAYKKGRDYETFKRKQTGNLDMESYYIPTFEVKKFADKLKDIVCMLIGCTRSQLEDRDFKEKELGEEWIKYILTYSDKYDSYTKTFLSEKEASDYIENENCVYYANIIKVNLTPRLLLQILGTEAGRGLIHPNLWVNSLMSEYKRQEVINNEWLTLFPEYEYPNWIVTDMRFPNELKAIKDRSGITIRVNRGESKSENEHESETALDEVPFDYVVNNSGTIEELIEKVKEILIKENIL